MTVFAKSQSNNKKKKYNKNQRRTQWSNLPHDLLNLIISKLYFTDRIRFCAVCKDWHVPIHDRPVNELPWTPTLFDISSPFVSEKRAKVMLLDPVHKKTHTIPNFAGVKDEYLNRFDGSSICASKCGWILLANYKRENETDIFLYSPFTNNAIMLPAIYWSITPYYCLATFSSTNPMSPNCIFVVTHYCYDQRRFGISTYRNGDNKWETKIVDGDFEHGVESLVCTEKGVCYLVLPSGKLVAFFVESQVWSWLVASGWAPDPRDYMHLIEFNGDLLLVIWCFNYDKCELYKYDENERDWLEQKSLGDIALFISCTSYLRPAIGDTSDLADKILFPYSYNSVADEIRVYSLKDGKWYEENGVFDWLVKDSHQKVWIEPPY